MSVVFSIFWLGQSWITEYVGLPVVIPLILGVFFGQVASLFMHFISGDLQIESTAIIRLSKNAVWIVAGVVFIWLGFGAIAIIYSYVLAKFVEAVWAVLRCKLEFGKPSVRIVRSLIEYAKYDVVSALSQRMHNWADVLIIGFFLSSTAVGVYEIAWRVTQLAATISTAISHVLFPEVSNAHSNGDHDKISKMLNKSVVWSTIFVIPAFFGGAIVGSEILQLIFDINPSELAANNGVAVLSILLLGQIAFVHFTPIKRVLDGVDKVNLAARTTAVMTILNVVLNIVLVYYTGVIGAAVATSISMVAGLFIATYYLKGYVKINYPFREVMIFTFASAIMGFVVYFLTRILPAQTYSTLTFAILTGALIYLCLLVTISDTRKLVKESAQKVS